MTTIRTWPIVTQSVAAAVAGYLMAAGTEFGLVGILHPSERELVGVSDAVLSAALGLAVYLWRHLSATRVELAERQRAELVLNTQLALAADLQRRLLPIMPGPERGIEWAASLHPAGQIGGDFYDVVVLGPGHWIVLVADVSGKGIPAAMALSTLRATFRSLVQAQHHPAQILGQLSSFLHEQWSGTPYVTGIVLDVDRPTGRLTYANAAHPAGILTSAGEVREMPSDGPPVALLPVASYREQTLAIAPGDRCILVSDGVTEALGDDGHAVVRELARSAGASPAGARGLCDRIMALALEGKGPEDVPDWQDDRTVLVLAVT